jgi:hypothetical protein
MSTQNTNSFEADVAAKLAELEAEEARNAEMRAAARYAERVEAAARAQIKQKQDAAAAERVAERAAKQALKDAEARQAAAEAAAAEAVLQAERLRLHEITMGAAKAKAFDDWARDNRFWPTVPVGWTMASVEKSFWECMEAQGGFKLCPTCGAKPKVNRIYTATVSCNPTTGYIEGLFTTYDHPQHGAVGYTLESISCCQHLFDVPTKQRFISVASMSHPPPVAKHVEYTMGQKWNKSSPTRLWEIMYIKPPRTPYAPYDHADPTGSKAAASAAEAAEVAEIAALEAQLKARLEGREAYLRLLAARAASAAAPVAAAGASLEKSSK